MYSIRAYPLSSQCIVNSGTVDLSYVPKEEHGELIAITRTHAEQSIVAPAHLLHIPGEWRSMRVVEPEGGIPFTELGIISRMTTTLADHAVSVFVVSTFLTDWLLVRSTQYGIALDALRSDGYACEEYSG